MRSIGQAAHMVKESHSVAATHAYVNHGRWIVDCPACNAGLQLPRGSYRAVLVFSDGGPCLDCGTLLRVIMPKGPDLIDAVLSNRPLLVNRNWYPSETVQELLDENEAHLGLDRA